MNRWPTPKQGNVSRVCNGAICEFGPVRTQDVDARGNALAQPFFSMGKQTLSCHSKREPTYVIRALSVNTRIKIRFTRPVTGSTPSSEWQRSTGNESASVVEPRATRCADRVIVITRDAPD